MRFPRINDQSGAIIGYVLLGGFALSLVGVYILDRIDHARVESLMLRGKFVIVNQRKVIEFDLGRRHFPDPL